MTQFWSNFIGDFLLALVTNFGVAAGSLMLGGIIGGGLAFLRFRTRWAGRVASAITGLLRASPTFVVMFFLLNIIPSGISVFDTTVPIPATLVLILALSVYSSAYVSDNLLDTLRHLDSGATGAALLFIPNTLRVFVVLVMASSTGAAIGVREAVTTTLRQAERLPTIGGRIALVLAVILFFALLMHLGRMGTAWLTGRIQDTVNDQAGAEQARPRGLAFGWATNKSTYGLVVTVVILLAIGGVFSAPLPPRSVTIGTGPVDGSWYQTALAYREYLEARGVTVHLKAYNATSTIIDYVNQPETGVEVGFVLQDVTVAQYDTVTTLGNIDYEPLFAFIRADAGTVGSLTALRGKRILLPPADSATSRITVPILAGFGVTAANTEISFGPLSVQVEAMKSGEAAAIFMMLRSDNPLIVEMATHPGLRMMGFRQAAALLQRFPELRAVTIPAATFDLEHNIPPDDLRLIAGSTQIIIHKDLHPAISFMLLEAMTATHRGATIVSRDGEFPALRGGRLPVADYVAAYYQSGVPWVYKELPRRLASIVGYYLVWLLPIVVLLPLYNWLALPRAPDLLNWLRSLIWVHTLRGFKAKLEGGGLLTGPELASLRMIHVTLNRLDRTSECRQVLGEVDSLRRRLAEEATGVGSRDATAAM